MLNQTWIDPRDVDWTDALNSVRLHGWNANNNPFVAAAFNDPIWQALRLAKGMEPRIFVCPEPANQLIQPGATYDYEVPSDPNTWLFGINASGDQRDFLLNVTDSVTGATLFTQPVNRTTISPTPANPAGRGVQYFVCTPHLYEPPSYPVVRIINTTSDPQVCRVTLFCAVELDI
jgi:hypothetical protein